MRIMFTKPGKYVRLADEQRLIFDFDDGLFYNSKGEQVPAEPGFKDEDVYDNDPWKQYWIKDEGLSEPLIAESITDIEYDIDEEYGTFGFKNRAGEFVIEPQYAYAHEFTCGLAAVNLQRTWYRNPEGKRWSEDHYGYINERGETVIPFSYSDASPFNKYRVATVYDNKGSHLIDTDGNIVPGTEGLDFYDSYDYDSRFLEISYSDDEIDENHEIATGIYDTKERRIILEPSDKDLTFIEWYNDTIKVYQNTHKMGDIDWVEYYIDSNGEKMFPWLRDKGFATVELPNKANVAIVSVAEYIELDGKPMSYFLVNDKKYERKFLHGIYSAKGKFIVPMEYDEIEELTYNIFACKKDGIITIIQVEEDDL